MPSLIRDKIRIGFTLIELLVCVAIIAILLAITLPALQRAKQMSYRVYCMNNLKQLGINFNNYCDENEGAWPPYTFNFSPGKSGNWLVFVKPPKGLLKQGKITGSLFEGLRSVYVCPADKTPTITDFYSEDGEIEYSEIPVSYAYNLLLYTDQVPYHKLRRASEMVVLFDSQNMIQQQGKWEADPDFYLEVLAERHNNGANHLFADFHVEWRPIITEHNLIPE